MSLFSATAWVSGALSSVVQPTFTPGTGDQIAQIHKPIAKVTVVLTAGKVGSGVKGTLHFLDTTGQQFTQAFTLPPASFNSVRQAKIELPVLPVSLVTKSFRVSLDSLDGAGSLGMASSVVATFIIEDR